MELHNYFYPKLSEDEKVCMVFNHQWWNLIHPMKGYDDVERNKRFYFVCGGDSALDRQANKFKIRKGFNVVVEDMARISDTTLYGDVVISIFYEPKLRKAVDNIFEKTKKIEDLDVPKMVEDVFKMETEIIMIINKNEDLAKQLKGRVMGLFSEKPNV